LECRAHSWSVELILSHILFVAEGTGAEEYSQMLPPPPVLPSSYSHSAHSTAEGDCDETYPLNTNTMDTNTGDLGYKDEQV